MSIMKAVRRDIGSLMGLGIREGTRKIKRGGEKEESHRRSSIENEMDRGWAKGPCCQRQHAQLGWAPPVPTVNPGHSRVTQDFSLISNSHRMTIKTEM